MKAIVFICLILLIQLPCTFSWSHVAHAGIALQSLDRFATRHPGLAGLLSSHANALLSGSVYPDVDYMPGCGKFFNEILHSQRFLDKYAEFVRTQCGPPAKAKKMGHKCGRLYAHLFGTFAHSAADSDFHVFFLPKILAQDPLTLDHNLAEELLDQYLILAYGTRLRKIRWNEPIEELLQVLRSIGSKYFIRFLDAYHGSCLALKHNYVGMTVRTLPTVWAVLGCRQGKLKKKANFETATLKSISLTVGKTEVEAYEKANQIVPPTEASSELIWRFIYQGMGELVSNAKGYPLEELKKINKGQCPLRQILDWTLNNMMDKRLKGSYKASVAKVRKVWEELTQFLKGVKGAEVPKLSK